MVDISRNVLSEILKGQIPNESVQEVADADFWIDESLDAIEFEEPKLIEFLQNHEIAIAFRATLSALYWIYMMDSQKGKSWYEILSRFETLLYRLSAACLHKGTIIGREQASNDPITLKML